MTQATPSPDIAALKHAGAQQLDPVHLHYLELLSTRAQAQPEPVKSILEARVAQAAARFNQRLQQAQSAPHKASQRPEPAEPEESALPEKTVLSELVRSLQAQAQTYTHGQGQQPSQAVLHAGSAANPELKSVRMFRNTWAKLSSERQLGQALDQAPKNAGPINSHMLVLRSLALMREISPDYLNRFMAYAQALLCLDQMERAKYTKPKTEAAKAAAPRTKKPKAARVR
jgi:hypothetical protein